MAIRILRTLILPSSLALLALSGCATFFDLLKSTTFQEPGLTFRRVDLTEITLGGLTLDTVWEVHNPNALGVSISQVEYALSVEGKRVLAGAPPHGLEIAAASRSELHFPAAVRFGDLAAVVETFLTKDTASYSAEGRVGFETPIGTVLVPLSSQGSFEVPKVPQVVLGNPRVASVSAEGATVEFPLAVTSRNSYALSLGRLQGNVSIGGAPVGTLTTDVLGALPGKGSRPTSVPLFIDFRSAAQAAIQAVQGGSAQVSLKARLESGPSSMPLTAQQLVQFIH